MKKGKELPPILERKPNMDINGDKISQSISSQKQREKHLHPLRIDARTVIYVKKEKCTLQYAEQYRKRVQYTPELKGTAIPNSNNSKN